MSNTASPTVGIVSKPRPGGSLPVLDALVAWLRDRNLPFLLDPEAAKLAPVGSWDVVEREAMPERADLIVVLGGDGTLLSVARSMGPREVPILGVNLGSLGFLTEVATHEMIPALETYLSGGATLQKRMMLQASLIRFGGQVARFHCLNDAVVNKGALARMIELHIEVDGAWLTDMRSDGLIVATPTGSTGYNLSAGGPILVPSMDGIIISPLCPHTLTMRPIIVDGRGPVDVTLLKGSERVYFTADGQQGNPLQDGDRVRIERSPFHVPLVVSQSRNYFALLREKLAWGSRYP